MARDQSARETAASTQAGAEPSDTAHQYAASTHAGAEPSDTARQYVPPQASRYYVSAADAEPSGTALGFTLAAAVLMTMSGIWNILEGLAAIIRGSFFVVLPNYAYNISVHGWGWFHFILGIVVLAAGVGLFTDKPWARALGVVIAAISAVVNFLYIPYLPVWSIVVIAIDIAIIWALLTPRRYTLRR
jgi:hypothetical protein